LRKKTTEKKDKNPISLFFLLENSKEKEAYFLFSKNRFQIWRKKLSEACENIEKRLNFGRRKEDSLIFKVLLIRFSFMIIVEIIAQENIPSDQNNKPRYLDEEKW